MPVLAVGEPGFTTDTHRLFIGSSAGNVLVSGGDASVGIEADLPTLTPGMFYFATDTQTLWIGTAGGNVRATGGAVNVAQVQGMIQASL